MEQWQTSLCSDLNAITKKCVQEWGGLINELGLEEQDRNEWVASFKTAVSELMGDVVDEVHNTQTVLIGKIEMLLKQSQQLCKQLGICMPKYGSQNLGLYKEEQTLSLRVIELQKQVNLRITEIHEINTQQDALCSQLGKIPIQITENPLPSKEQMQMFDNHIQDLYKEKNLRLKQFKTLKAELLTIANELKVKPELDFERLVLYGDEASFILSDSNMKMLHNFRKSMVQQMENVTNEIAALREKIRNLWETLARDMHECDKFLHRHSGNSLDTVDALRAEMKHCTDLRRANMKRFILKMREELTSCWENCKYSSEQRAEFEHYDDDLYTDDLFTIHELEIERLKQFYMNNRKIFELLDEREKLWSKMTDLEELARAPNRYRNRGGQLLKEEKERNALRKKIPVIEERLLVMAADFEMENKKPFLYWGDRVEDVIQKSHEQFEVDKKLKLSAIKQQRELTPKTPSMLSLTRSVSTQNLRLTPLQSSNYTNRTPRSTLKRPSKATPIGMKSAPPKISKGGIAKNKLVYSTEKKKRISKLRRLSKIVQENESAGNNETSSTYELFKTELSSRNTCRSTTFKKQLSDESPPERQQSKVPPRRTPIAPKIMLNSRKITASKFNCNF